VFRYKNGGFDFAAAWYDAHDTNPSPVKPFASSGVDNNRQLYIGAKYKIDKFSFSASYGNGRNPAHSNLVDYDLFSLGLGYQPAPDFALTSGVYYLTDKNNSANKSLTWAIAANYFITKRKTLYANVGGVNNVGNMSVPITYGQFAAPGRGAVASMIGIRHAF